MSILKRIISEITFTRVPQISISRITRLLISEDIRYTMEGEDIIAIFTRNPEKDRGVPCDFVTQISTEGDTSSILTMRFYPMFNLPPDRVTDALMIGNAQNRQTRFLKHFIDMKGPRLVFERQIDFYEGVHTALLGHFVFSSIGAAVYSYNEFAKAGIPLTQLQVTHDEEQKRNVQLGKTGKDEENAETHSHLEKSVSLEKEEGTEEQG